MNRLLTPCKKCGQPLKSTPQRMNRPHIVRQEMAREIIGILLVMPVNHISLRNVVNELKAKYLGEETK